MLMLLYSSHRLLYCMRSHCMSKDYAKAHVCFRLIKMNTFSHNGPDRDQTFFFFFFLAMEQYI